MGVRAADFDRGAFGFVDVAAEEMGGLAALDEVADGGGSGVQAGADLIERGAVGRRVADQHQRREQQLIVMNHLDAVKAQPIVEGNADGIRRARGVRYSALGPNLTGARRALSAGFDEIEVVVSASARTEALLDAPAP